MSFFGYQRPLFAVLRARNNTKKCCLGHQLQTDTQHCVTLIILKRFFSIMANFEIAKIPICKREYFCPSATETFFLSLSPLQQCFVKSISVGIKMAKNFHRKLQKIITFSNYTFFCLFKFCHNRKNKSYICFDRLESGKLIRQPLLLQRALELIA